MFQNNNIRSLVVISTWRRAKQKRRSRFFARQYAEKGEINMTGKHANIKKLEDLAVDVKSRAQRYGRQAKEKVSSAVSKGRDILRKKNLPS